MNYKLYKKSKAITDYKEFPNRSHYILGESGWEEVAYDAVLRNLQIIGEAAKAIPADVRQAHPEVDWKGMAGLRDVLTHAYFGLDDETLWDGPDAPENPLDSPAIQVFN